MSNEQKEGQAAKLQQLFSEVNNQPIEEKKEKVTEEQLIEVDVLNLPPRSQVHQSTNMSLRLDINRPLWRFLTVIIVLLIIASLVYFLFGEQVIDFFT